jgi:hypothetical protein
MDQALLRACVGVVVWLWSVAMICKGKSEDCVVIWGESLHIFGVLWY